MSGLRLAVVLTAAATAGHGVAAQTGASSRATSLIAGARIERGLAAGEVARYAVRAAAGEYVRIVVERPGPLTIAVTSGANVTVAERARVEPRDGPETLSWVAARTGVYRVELRPRDPKRPTRPHAITLAPPHPASETDTRAAAAERQLERGDALRLAGRESSLREALTVYGVARDEWRALEQAAGEAEALLGLGLAYRGLSENTDALAAYEAALSRARAANDRWVEVLTLQNMALVYRSWGEHERARGYYQEALELARISNDERARSEAAAGLARIAFELGDAATALPLYEESVRIAREVGDPRVEGYALNGIANVYHLWGDTDRAIELWRESLARRQAAGDALGPASSMSNIGVALLDSGRPADALPYFNRALALARSMGNRRSEAQFLNTQARALAALGRPVAARTAIARGIDLAAAVGDQRLHAELLTASVALGTLPSAAGDERLSRALDIWRRLGDLDGEVATWLAKAAVERATGRLDAALGSVTQALGIIERQRRRIPIQTMRASYLGATRRAFELRIDLLMQLDARHPERDYAAEALHASEEARARSLLDMLAETRGDIRDGVPAALLAREQEARRRLSDAAARAAAPSPRADPAALSDAVEAALLEFERLEAEVRASSPRYHALVQPVPLTVAELQRQVVDDDSRLVEFALGDERSYVWIVGRTDITAHVLPARRTIEEAARRVHETVAASHRPGRATAARGAAAHLSRLILAPIAARLEHKRLLIVPDGALQFVPFAALPRPGAQNAAPEPLIARPEIVQLPSASVVPVLRAAAAGRQAPDRLLAVLADPVLAADDPRLGARATRRAPPGPLPLDLARSAASTGATRFERLLFTRQEAMTIGALAGAAPALVALDFDASRATALDPALSRYRYLHFASHALLNAQHPELSGIVLSLVSPDGRQQDGFLRLHDIYNMRLAADLVVLSACRTALGREVRGEGLVGLTRGFMYAGAPRVLASLWDVRDEPTADLMTRFYQFVLKDGLRPAAALRAAQLAMSKDPARSAPAHWAGFVLQGEWR